MSSQSSEKKSQKLTLSTCIFDKNNFLGSNIVLVNYSGLIFLQKALVLEIYS